jgi:hypothetical protein
MSAINKLIDWMEENKDVKLSPDFIKLQAQVFSLEEKYNMQYFETVTNIFNKKINDNAGTNSTTVV